jgi:putative intracellular protease/amidase
MIGLSVAVGRFVEALFWAILRAAGGVTVAVLAGALVLAATGLLTRRWWRKRRA